MALLLEPISDPQKNMFDYAGASGGFIDFFVYPFCRGRLFNTIEEDNGQYDNSVKVFSKKAVGGNLKLLL